MSQEVEALLPFPPSSQDTLGPIVVICKSAKYWIVLKTKDFSVDYTTGKKNSRAPAALVPDKTGAKRTFIWGFD